MAVYAQQNALMLPWTPQQFTNTNGTVLANGKVCTYQAGTSTGLATYTDSTASVANSIPPNAILLDSTGRATSGGIWLKVGLAYKIVVLTAGSDGTCNTGVTIKTQDNVVGQAGASLTGNNVLTGTNTFTSLFTKTFEGTRQMADQFAGDFCAKILAPSQVSGVSVVDATGLAGAAQTCGASITLSTSNVAYVLPANMTVTVTSGVTITITGNDVLFTGGGDTTLFDFSAGTSSANDFFIRGNRDSISYLKVIGNRVAGGTSNAFSVNPSSGTIDRDAVIGTTVLNSGNRAVYAFGVTNLTIKDNTWLSSGLSGFFLDTPFGGTSNQYILIDHNIGNDYNLTNNSGDGGIIIRAILLTDAKDVIISHNFMTLVSAIGHGVGIGVNGGTDGIDVHDNRINQNASSGEGIAVTANNAHVHHNYVNLTGACGVLVYENATFFKKVTVDHNTVQSGTPGMCVNWGANTVTLTDIIVDHNQSYGNQNFGLQTSSGFAGMALSNVQFYENALFGNTNPMSLLTAGVTGFYNEWANNSGLAPSASIHNEVPNASYTFTETTVPAGLANDDVCYGDSTAHAIKCSYNNGTFFQIPQVITATSAAFATATTAGTCVQNTTAVTNAATSMAVSVSPVSTPGVGAVWSAFVSSAGNVTINECAVATSAGGTIAFNIRVTP